MLPYIILFVLGEDGEPFLEERDKLVSHLIEFGDVRVGVDIAEPGADRIVDEKQIRKLMP